MLQAVLFDLDGTLLPMKQEEFLQDYLGRLSAKVAPLGYEKHALIDAIWDGTRQMVQNDGSKTNEAVFWQAFSARFGERVQEHIPVFDAFYREEFQKSRAVCGQNPKAAELIHTLQKKRLHLVLATNPVFPAVATESRIRWAGLSPSDFELVTTYENIGFCKPSPAYYTQIAKQIGVSPEFCLMVGNDVEDDLPAEQTGMKVFLLTDCLINRKQADLSHYPHGGFDALQTYLDTLLSEQ